MRRQKAHDRHEELGREVGLEEARRGEDPQAMLHAMDVEGIDVSIVFRTRAAHVVAVDGLDVVEVMISVALVLLLMYGVSQVFKMSSDAVGANQAVSKIVRDQRSAQAVLAQDMRNCASDSPLFLICSRIGYGGPALPAPVLPQPGGEFLPGGGHCGRLRGLSPGA